MYRSPSPYAPIEHGNPYQPQSQQPPQGYGPGPAGAAGQITPGAVTYTTSTNADGRVVYHPFKAVAASYQTPNGIVSGIQWVPAEATQILPAGAQPASSDFAASWNRGYLNKDDQKALKDWQRDEEKKRKKEEKESKRILQHERMGSNQRNDPDYDLRMARERDAQSVIGRRKSFNAGAIPPGGVAFPSSGTGGSSYSAVSSNGYPSSPYQSYIEPAGVTGYGAAPQAGSYGGGRERKASSGASYNDINRQFGDMGLGRDGEYGGGERERKTSGLGRPRKYSNYGGSDAPSERARAISGNFGAGDRPAPYGGTGGYVPAAGGYGGGKGHPYPVAGSAYSNPSPNMRPSEIPYGAANSTGYPGSSFSSSPAHGAADPIARSTTPYGATPAAPQVYPRGHVMEGQPIIPRSRAASPNPGAIPFPQGPVAFPQAGASPRMGGASPRIGGASPLMRGTSPRPGAFPGDQQNHQQLAAPEGFSRPINASLPYTPFDTMKIQDMDEFMERQPRMPLVLQPHDVYHEDWSRLMKDLTLAWSGTLPVPALAQNGHQPRRSQLAADLIDLWNSSFFLARGVELVLFKGRERRSGAHAGTVDQNLPNYDDDDDDLSSSDDSSSEESDDSDVPTGPYGRPPGTYDDTRRRKEAKVERKKMRRREKKQRRKERAKAKKYALYITCIPQRVPGMQPSAAGMPGGYPGASSGYPASSQPGYPTVQPGYPGGQPGYPAAPSAYTTGHSGYPAAQQGYVPQAGGYPSAPSSHGGYGAHGHGSGY